MYVYVQKCHDNTISTFKPQFGYYALVYYLIGVIYVTPRSYVSDRRLNLGDHWNPSAKQLNITGFILCCAPFITGTICSLTLTLFYQQSNEPAAMIAINARYLSWGLLNLMLAVASGVSGFKLLGILKAQVNISAVALEKISKSYGHDQGFGHLQRHDSMHEMSELNRDYHTDGTDSTIVVPQHNLPQLSSAQSAKITSMKDNIHIMNQGIKQIRGFTWLAVIFLIIFSILSFTYGVIRVRLIVGDRIVQYVALCIWFYFPPIFVLSTHVRF